MKKQLSIGLVAVSLLAMGSLAFGFTGQQYAEHAKASLEQARLAALKAHPGRISDED